MEYFRSKTRLNIVVSTDEGESVGLLAVKSGATFVYGEDGLLVPLQKIPDGYIIHGYKYQENIFEHIGKEDINIETAFDFKSMGRMYRDDYKGNGDMVSGDDDIIRYKVHGMVDGISDSIISEGSSSLIKRFLLLLYTFTGGAVEKAITGVNTGEEIIDQARNKVKGKY